MGCTRGKANRLEAIANNQRDQGLNMGYINIIYRIIYMVNKVIVQPQCEVSTLW